MVIAVCSYYCVIGKMQTYFIEDIVQDWAITRALAGNTCDFPLISDAAQQLSVNKLQVLPVSANTCLIAPLESDEALWWLNDCITAEILNLWLVQEKQIIILIVMSWVDLNLHQSEMH